MERVRTIALWVAPGDGTPAADQIASIRDQLPDPKPDLLVFPEAWIEAPLSERDHLESYIGRALPGLRKLGIRAIVGVALTDGNGVHEQVMVDLGMRHAVYEKHSTAPHVAFERGDWSPGNNLSPWPGGIGVTICHDMYPSLFAHYLKSRGAKLLVNPSEWPVLRRKWETVLAARAEENRMFVACSVHQERAQGTTGGAWVFAPTGERVELTSMKGRERHPYGNTAGTLYVADLDKGRRLPADARVAKPSTDSASLPVRVEGDFLRIGRRAVSWGKEAELPPFTVIPIGPEELADPCSWVEPLLRAKGKAVFWIRVPRERAREAKSIASARAIELCCPSVIDIAGEKPLVIELYNKSKGVRWVSPPRISPQWQFGYDSAFRMLRGFSEPPSAWKKHVGKYRELLVHRGRDQSLAS